MSVPRAVLTEFMPPPRRAHASLEEKVRALHSHAAYDDCPGRIEAIETHFAWVFLTDEYAYKLKKPVRTAYADLTHILARRFSCSEELRLNRRLAPDVYLGLTPLVRRADGSLHLGGAGDIVDWLVRMRRLPSALMLDRAIAAGTASRTALVAIGQMLARFYGMQLRIDFEPAAYVERIAGQIRVDRRDLFALELKLSPALIRSTTAAVWLAFARVEDDLAVRARQRHIVEAHGDLRPEHICLSEPPCVIDSLEFSEDLRTLDPPEELAFLCVECARAGGAQAGEDILNAYLGASGDPITASLLDFYRSRRAMVRAKLIAWHLADPQVSGLAAWGEQAEGILTRALEYAQRVVG